MPAFYTVTELFNHFRRNAQALGCNPCFDSKIEEIEAMNEKGSNGVPACLCKTDTGCPCKDAQKEIERDGECYCGIFRRK